jgi:prevent-host-death family protein
VAVVNLVEAKARLSELVTRAAAGETISITRRGKTIAQLTGAKRPKTPIRIEELRAITDAMKPHDGQPETVRHMRDTDRY